MNTTASVCKRCNYTVENDICGQCGLCLSSYYHQYCDMCNDVIYSGNVSKHNCREKEDGMSPPIVRSISPKHRPHLRPKGQFVHTYTCGCGDVYDSDKISAHTCMCDKSFRVQCDNCKRIVTSDCISMHTCTQRCSTCYKDVKNNKLHKHRCVKQAFASSYFTNYGVSTTNKCADCNESIKFTHECKKAVNIANKRALCLCCNGDITDNWRDHSCHLGDSYVDVRCADCTQIRTVMMFRYHECSKGPDSKCGNCHVELKFDNVIKHSCHSGIALKDLIVKCITCDRFINYLKLHSHGANCRRFTVDNKAAIAMCYTCGDELKYTDLSTHGCYKDTLPTEISMLCIKCYDHVDLLNILKHSSVCKHGIPEEDSYTII